MATSIEWTDATWNPVTGCTKVSAGCKNCYAETVADRFWATQYPHVPIGPTLPDGGPTAWRDRRFTDVQCHEDRLVAPLSWRKPRKVFVNSMSDLFHEDVPAAFIERVFSVMGRAERHMFQVLTKRPERMLQWFSSRRFDCKGAAILQTENIGECHYALPWPLPNVWLGVSCENQATADERIPLLVQTPSAVRFLSCEPLLAAINLDGLWGYPGAADSAQLASWPIQWVIAGGESGPAARPCALEWIAAIVEQCRTAGVACFVKQLGAYVVSEHRTAPDDCFAGTPPHRAPNGEGWAWRMGLANRKGGDPAEWPEDLRVREFPAVTQP